MVVRARKAYAAAFLARVRADFVNGVNLHLSTPATGSIY